MSERQEKVGELIKELAAIFFVRETNTNYLLTVTKCEITSDLKNARIFITVLPEKEEDTAIKFAKSKRSDLRDYLKEKMTMKFMPKIEIEIDLGEKNRQRIEELSYQK